jgi:hypothetical protein
MAEQLLQLYQPESGRRLRIEAPTVFGRSPVLYPYEGMARREFSESVLSTLQRMDFVEVKGDILISRTHGVLDPQGPSIQDLNSRNGVLLNGSPITPTTTSGDGPAVAVKHGDIIRVGEMNFVVEWGMAEERTFYGPLWAMRHAVLAPGLDPQMAELEEFLRDRKRFGCVSVDGWDALREQLTRLAHPALADDGTGITAIVLRATPSGTHLELGGETRRASWLIEQINALNGSKILALHSEGDPAAFERVFEAYALEDALLITSSVPGGAALLEEPLIEEICTAPVERVRQSVGGGGSLAAYHGIRDGLDALVPADTNLLSLAWYRGYEGALTLTSGTIQPFNEEEVGTAYVASAPVPMSRRRYRFESAPAPERRDD